VASRGFTELIVIHCAATKPSQDIGAREIDAMHRGFGWSGIGYHGVIRRNGNLELGRPWDDLGAHVKGHNARSVGVCLVGGLDEAGVPAAKYAPVQMETLRLVVDGLLQRYPDARVLGHRDLSPDMDDDGVVEPHEWIKACPSFEVSTWMATGTVVFGGTA